MIGQPYLQFSTEFWALLLLRLLSFRLIFRQVRLSRIKYSPNGVGMSWVGRPGLSGLRGAPKGINYNAGGNNTAAASQEVRQCHRSFWKQRRGRVSRLCQKAMLREGAINFKTSSYCTLCPSQRSRLFWLQQNFWHSCSSTIWLPPPKKSSYAILTRYCGKYCSR